MPSTSFPTALSDPDSAACARVPISATELLFRGDVDPAGVDGSGRWRSRSSDWGWPEMRPAPPPSGGAEVDLEPAEPTAIGRTDEARTQRQKRASAPDLTGRTPAFEQTR